MILCLCRLSPSNSLLELNGNTGELKTTQPIDREELENNPINILAVSTSGSHPPIDIFIEVTDINDNDPVFPDTATVNLDISESIEIGTQVGVGLPVFRFELFYTKWQWTGFLLRCFWAIFVKRYAQAVVLLFYREYKQY